MRKEIVKYFLLIKTAIIIANFIPIQSMGINFDTKNKTLETEKNIS